MNYVDRKSNKRPFYCWHIFKFNNLKDKIFQNRFKGITQSIIKVHKYIFRQTVLKNV